MLRGYWKKLKNHMDIITVQKFVRISPKKMRGVADIAKKLTPQDAVSKLPFLRKRGSEVLVKVIKTSLASAKQKGISDDTLVFKEIQIGEGPKLKRGRAASRGRWHPYKRRMSHIRVVLTVRKSEDQNLKSETKVEKEESGLKDSGLAKNVTGKVVSKSVQSVGKVLKSVVSGKRGKSGGSKEITEKSL